MWLNERIEQTRPIFKEGFFDLFEKFGNYRCKVPLTTQTDGFLVKTADSYEEVLQAFSLRHQVFKGENRAAFMPYEFDEFDMDADHILVIAKTTNEVVATYRLICSRFAKIFYSQSEFYIDDVVKTNLTFLEMGRACINPAYRNTNLIDLMWGAIGSYINKTGVDALFGLASFFTIDEAEAWQFDAYLKKNFCDKKFLVWPKEAFRLDPTFRKPAYELDDSDIKKRLPNLLRSYLLAGSQIYGDPAIDRDFACVDFFVYLDLAQIHPSFKKRYLSRRAGKI